ncbi:malto-oligosyltrehalose synthase [Telmatospirillum sp. J64-1]|uniref:malto-oligosyltrehalose synthase n=1 Tax=Telmatospirillum sp. J64-1 TaxID=2502183 RepID=UPI00115E3525|nr:malto-oligosyltrehalose synthase [Telmatospirillum sp. J64-1]
MTEKTGKQGAGKVIPRATYRLQFSKDFGFRRAAELAPYLARLGVSHVYASPYLKARPGSSHGYDIVDHNALNPELGGTEDYEAFVTALRRAGLGQILDFVPNHMGVGGSDNLWWLDVLEWGQDSPYAGYFDIDWGPDRRYLHGKLLVPFLGDQYGAVLDAGQLKLKYDAEAGSFAVWAYDTHKMPICPLHYARILGDAHLELERLGDEFAGLPTHRPHVHRHAAHLKARLAQLTRESEDIAQAVAAAVESFNAQPDALDALIQEQHWRAAYFRVAADDINYRRFFNINDLAGLRMEEPELFDLTHILVFKLIENGVLDGLRIDHIDGLLDPKRYCESLIEKSPRPIYLVVEKILARHERLREDWPIDGTTGYDFANLVGGLLVDPAGEEPLSRFYADFTGQDRDFADIVRDCKIRIMENEMASELNVLARDAARIARSNRKSCDFTNHILHTALKEIIARFPVYRTYIDGSDPDEADRRDLDWAITQARREENAADASAFDFLQALLTTDLVREPRSGYSRHAVVRLAMKVQQYSGPVMAKGLEDTAFYRYNRLVSLNEVGGHPDHFGVSVAAFHAANAERLKRWPHNMLGSSTHDTKRGEDTRARINVLSEMPEEWERQVSTWSRLLRARRGDVEGTAPPDRNDEYLFYQLLLGAWPAELTGSGTPSPEAMEDFGKRIEGAMMKSMREAKLHSNWAAPNMAYEEAMYGFIRDALDVSRHNAFLEAFLPFQERVAQLGVTNSLTQTLLKLTVPGVPDIYQGAELWDLSLVDPDNRRPVDYRKRIDMLERIGTSPLPDLLAHWQDGAAKLGMILRTLDLRRRHPDLFAQGSYHPIEASGAKADHACAFLRQTESAAMLVATTRLPVGLEAQGWGETTLPLPEGHGGSWHNLFTGETVTASGESLRAEALFGGFPVALLVPAGMEDGLR